MQQIRSCQQIEYKKQRMFNVLITLRVMLPEQKKPDVPQRRHSESDEYIGFRRTCPLLTTLRPARHFEDWVSVRSAPLHAPYACFLRTAATGPKTGPDDARRVSQGAGKWRSPGRKPAGKGLSTPLRKRTGHPETHRMTRSLVPTGLEPHQKLGQIRTFIDEGATIVAIDGEDHALASLLLCWESLSREQQLRISTDATENADKSTNRL
jgi:hypothetical protein